MVAAERGGEYPLQGIRAASNEALSSLDLSSVLQDEGNLKAI